MLHWCCSAPPLWPLRAALWLCLRLPDCQLGTVIRIPQLHLSLLAPPTLRSLGSTVVRQPLSFTTLPRPPGSTLVSHCSAYTTDFWTFGCTSSLHLFSFVGLLPPSGSTLVIYSYVLVSPVLSMCIYTPVLVQFFVFLLCDLCWFDKSPMFPLISPDCYRIISKGCFVGYLCKPTNDNFLNT